MSNVQDLLDRFWAGDRRMLARAISIFENEGDGHSELKKQIYAKTGNAYLLGMTGPPGAGKSSLIDRLTSLLRREGAK